MCGIVGAWVLNGVNAEVLHALVREMRDTLTYRGPDSAGDWLEEPTGLGFGHRRLSILDLSAEGHQPMISPSGRFVISYNGEVYNSVAMRRELEPAGFRFRGHSDTEVMLAAIEHWGVEAAVTRFIGMFAFALWDRQARVLSLVRDRLGIKPLYYGWAGRHFVFGSELKALRACPGFDNPINRDALALFLRHNYIPGPYSIYQHIYKLQPGTLLPVTPQLASNRTNAEDLNSRSSAYWSARQVAEQGTANRFTGSPEEAVEQLDVLLRDAVRLRMVADVPLGAFLSGGVDSSTVVALMQAQSARPVKTFSIGFHEDGYDEARHARSVARHLGTEHTELYVTPQEAMAVIPSLPQMFDEPFADSSQIPTFLVSKLARTQVTVSLSGDGGDELFAGYNRYFWGRRLWGKIGWIPTPARRFMASALQQGSPSFWDGLLEPGMRFFPQPLRVSQPGDKMQRLAEVLTASSADELYRQLVSHWPQPAEVLSAGREPPTVLNDPARQAWLADYTERMMYMDLVSYLPDDILTKVDRASMAVSLESRVPLLDHRVVEFAWSLPLSLKIRGGQGKWVLRQVLDRYVPRELIERPKMGFGVPIDEWLRGPLRDWAESLLAPERLQREGFFNPEPIRAKWQEHLSGKRRWHYHLWDALMFQSWFESVSSPA